MDDNNSPNNMQQWGQYYASLNWVPIPIKPKSKIPDLGAEWQNQTDVPSNIARIEPTHNIGINLGASGDLTDIDLDCEEAWLLAPYFLPATGAIFGRQTAPNSHWLYRCQQSQTKKYAAPASNLGQKSMIAEIRASGQTVFPPSTHKETHEVIAWNGDAPWLLTIRKDDLETAVGKLASAVLLVRHLQPGSFHDATVALAGALLRIWGVEDTVDFITVIGQFSGMQDLEDRKKIVRDTARKLEHREQNVSGWPSLKQYIPDEVVDKIMEWLKVDDYKAKKIFGSSPLPQANNQPHENINVTPWNELSKRHFSEMQWIVDTLLPPGVSLIVGRPKQGKSWLVHGIGLLVAAGRPVFGMKTTKCDVLYLALEDSERRLQGRTQKLMATHNLCDQDIQGFHYATDAPRLGENLEEALCSLLETKKDIRLLIIDVLTKIRTGRKGNQSIYEYDYDVGNRLKEVSKSHPDIAFLVVHHQNKGQGDALDSISGTHGLAGGFDNTFAFVNSSGGMELHINGRDIENSDPIPLLKGDDGMWTLEARDSAVNTRNSDTRNMIINALRDRVCSPKDISIETGIDTNTINSSLRRMCTQGIVVKCSHGKYVLPNPFLGMPTSPHTNRTD